MKFDVLFEILVRLVKARIIPPRTKVSIVTPSSFGVLFEDHGSKVPYSSRYKIKTLISSKLPQNTDDITVSFSITKVKIPNDM